MDYKWLYRPL